MESSFFGVARQADPSLIPGPTRGRREYELCAHQGKQEVEGQSVKFPLLPPGQGHT